MIKINKVLLISLVAVVLLLSGCATKEEPKEKPTLKIGYLPITHSALPLIVNAQTNGTLENFNLEMVKFSSWTDMAEAIKAGKIDGGGSILNSLAINSSNSK